MNLTQLIEPVIEIARLAGIEIMKIYNTEDFGIQYKNDNSPLTIADEAANKIIVEGLLALTPNISIVSEESQAIPFEKRRHFDYFWLVDPLDGTKEFVARNGEFAVNIALIHRKKAVLGVVYVPITEGVYFATKGGGSFKIVHNLKEKIKCNSFNVNDLNLKVLVSRSHKNPATDALLAAYNDPILIPQGSSIKFLSIAEGSADIFPRNGKTMEWDTAAPQIILEEAGGKILNLETKKPLIYNKKDLGNPNFIATGRVKTAKIKLNAP